MSRKTTERKTRATNPQPKRAIDDNYVAPKRKPKAEKHVSLQEALAEQAAEEGKTIEEVQEELVAPTTEESPVRPAGTSNLATTIRSHRANYNPMLHPNGKKTQNNGDLVAVQLLSIPLATLKAFSATRFERAYDHLNPGHARMCIGNLIRAAVKKGETDVVEWLAANQPKQDEQA